MSILSQIKSDLSRQRKSITVNAKAVSAIKPSLSRFEKGMRKFVDKDISTSAFFDGDKVCVMYYISYLESFKDERVVKLLGRIDELNPVKAEVIDYASSLNREYRFDMGDGVRVVVATYVKSDSGLCRKVLTKVESRVTQHEIYEMVCE